MLVDIDEIDINTLGLIDKNSNTNITNHVIVVYNAYGETVYQNRPSDLKFTEIIPITSLIKKQEAFNKVKSDEYYGLKYTSKGKDYFGIISANDKFGNSKLQFLKYILIISYLIFTLVCWISASVIVNKSLKPLYRFYENIKTINESNLNKRLRHRSSKDEISLLTYEFNLMLERIEKSYISQKEFSALVSHELRTPISRIISKIENKLIQNEVSEHEKIYLKELLKNIEQLNGLINTLLILSKVSETGKPEPASIVRIDELIMDCFDECNKQFENPQIIFEIKEDNALESLIEFSGNKELLKIAFLNLIQNAIKYSIDNKVAVYVSVMEQKLFIEIVNKGETIADKDIPHIFDPFVRSHNSGRTRGFGIGLLIVKRVFDNYNINIKYKKEDTMFNVFEIYI